MNDVADLILPDDVQGHTHIDAQAQAEALTAQVATALRDALRERGRALLVVSGGRSPVPFFQRLACEELDWAKVQVSLADERWVAPDEPASNEGLVRRHLLQGPAAQAAMLGLYQPAANLDEAAELADQALAGLPRIDVLVLGMGEDGHTASLFPHSANLDEALDPACPRRVLAMQAPSEPRQRLTQTLPALADARLSLLAIEGTAKLATLNRALHPGPAGEMPIRALLRAPLQVHWSP